MNDGCIRSGNQIFGVFGSFLLTLQNGYKVQDYFCQRAKTQLWAAQRFEP